MVTCPICGKDMPNSLMFDHIGRKCASPTPSDLARVTHASSPKDKQKEQWGRVFSEGSGSGSGSKGKGKGKAREEDRDPQTPVPADYFSWSGNGGAVRTPKAVGSSGRSVTDSSPQPESSLMRRDSSSSPAQTPRISEILKKSGELLPPSRQHSLLLNSDPSTGRPGLFKLASRSMIDIPMGTGL